MLSKFPSNVLYFLYNVSVIVTFIFGLTAKTNFCRKQAMVQKFLTDNLSHSGLNTI